MSYENADGAGTVTADKLLMSVGPVSYTHLWYQDGGGKWIEQNLPEIIIYESGAPDHDGDMYGIT